MSVLWQPVWKRHEYDVLTSSGWTAADAVRFRVRVADSEADALNTSAGEVIYEGVATAAPGENAIPVSLNNIAAAYLSAPVKRLGDWVSQELGRFFALDVFYSDDTWNCDEVIFFYDDWSYDADFNVQTMGLSHPIRGKVQRNMWAVCSVVDWDDAQSVDCKITYADGTTDTFACDMVQTGDFNNDFNLDFSQDTLPYAVAGYVGFNLGGLIKEPVRVQFIYTLGAILADYEVVPACSRYALYYRNAYGGMDALLLDGIQRKENYARANVGRYADNSVIGWRGVQNYRNGVTEGWVLRLNNLTDAEAARMHELVGSPEVWLCDTIADTLTPLVLTDTECEDKAFRYGHQRINYRINATTGREMKRQ